MLTSISEQGIHRGTSTGASAPDLLPYSPLLKSTWLNSETCMLMRKKPHANTHHRVTQQLRLEASLEVIWSSPQDDTQRVYCQGWRIQKLSGQPVSVLQCLHSEEVFSYVQTEPPAFQFMPIPLDPSPSITEKSPSESILPQCVSVYNDKIPRLLSSLSSPSSQPLLIREMLQSLEYKSGFSQVVSFPMEHRNGHSTAETPTSTEYLRHC